MQNVIERNSQETVAANNNTVSELKLENKEDAEQTKVAEESALEKTLDELLQELHELTGLAGVKAEVDSLINMIKANKIRKARGLALADVSKHLVFLGNPGTGKTTVARLLSNIYKQLGVLERGHLVEVDRSGLVAGFVGQTALKTKEKIDEAMGGILFVDEAYTLAKAGNDFGQEAIDTILKAMEDHRDRFVVIVAGYDDQMQRFLKSNPGLQSRFNKKIVFEDYSADELYSIFDSFCSKGHMVLNEDARCYVKKHIESMCENKPDNFANGREMRNLYEKALSKQMNRVAPIGDSISDEELMEIRVEDFA